MKRCERAKLSKNIILTITLLFFLVFASATVLADPGQNSTLLLQSGTLNGEAISPSDRTITVTPGETITGDLTVEYDSAWNPDFSAPLGYTPTWGDHETSFFWDGSHAQSTGTKTFSIDTTAPTTEGTYHLIAAYRAEIDGADVFSMTNWANNPEVWNDGNDIASLSSTQITTANSQGNVQADVLFDSGMQSTYLPATAVEIEVVGEPSDEQSICYQHFDNYTKSCEVGEFRDLGTVGGNPRCHLMRCEDSQRSMISDAVYCEVPDETGNTYFEIHWFSGDKNNTMCVEDECLEDDETYERSPDFRTCTEGDPLYAPNPTTPQASLETHSQFPVDFNNVFWCNAQGFEPTSYDWNFGDGTTQNDVLLSEIWHKFPDDGNYTVTCTAKNDNTSASASTTVNIETPVPASFFADAHPSEEFGGVYVQVEQQEGLTYEFSCDDIGFRGYIRETGWEVFNDEGFQHRFDTSQRTINYTLPEEGNYTAYCNMASGENRYNPGYWNGPGGIPNKRVDCPPQQVCLGAHNFLDFTATNETDEEPVCHSTVTELPATCNGGTIVNDENSGSCRTIECSNNGDSLTVFACDKPDTSEKTHFEMYKQSSAGSPPEICIAETCLQDEGYKRSTQDYPICTEEPEPDTSADIQLVDGFPYDHNYAFECNADFNATNYTFDFGDGTSETRPVFDVYHTYEESGQKTVSCTATGEDGSASDSMTIDVNVGEIDENASAFPFGVNVSVLSSTDNTYTFSCNTSGYDADLRRWFISNDTDFIGDHVGNGETLTYTFNESGIYRVDCNAHLTGEGDTRQLPQYFDYNSSHYHDASGLCTGMPFGTCVDISDTEIINVDDEPEPVCAESVGDLPATCEGGTFTTDDTSGSCRTLLCEGSGSSMQVLACDKPDGEPPQYFEMYKQSQSGTGVQQICLADSCITNGEFDGYERGGDYPVCSEEPPSDGDAEISIHPIFPEDQAYVFQCNTDFNATEWTWDLGDGTTVTRNGTRTYTFGGNPYGPDEVPNNDVFHEYAEGGQYSVSCTATDGSQTATGTTSVDVSHQFKTTAESEHLQGMQYRFTCDPATYDHTPHYSGTVWDITNTDKNEKVFFNGPYGQDSLTLDFTFNESGNYSVICRPRSGDDRWREDYWKGDESGYSPCNSAGGCVDTVSDPISIQVESTATSVDLRIKEWYPQGRDYVFVCEESGYDATSYFWTFGDGDTQTTTSDNVYHTYDSSGDYTVMCEASNGATESDTLQINVE